MNNNLETKLKKAIKRGDKFSVSILLTRIKNAGMSVVTIDMLERELERIDKIASVYRKSDDIGACYNYNNYHEKKRILDELRNEVY